MAKAPCAFGTDPEPGKAPVLRTGRMLLSDAVSVAGRDDRMEASPPKLPSPGKAAGVVGVTGKPGITTGGGTTTTGTGVVGATGAPLIVADPDPRLAWSTSGPFCVSPLPSA